MKDKELNEKIRNVFKKYGLEQQKFKLLNTYHTVGTCSKNGVIGLSRPSLMINDDDAIRTIILHEIAHTKHFNHGKEFHKLCKELNVDESIILPVTKYIVFCPRCKNFGRTNQLPDREMYCRYCKENNKKQRLMSYKHLMR